MSAGLRIRAIADADWDGIAALEAAVYTPLGLSEGRAALESRAASSPGTCFVLDGGRGAAGYVLALPYPLFQCPDLTLGEASAFPSRNLHLHDLVIAEHLRGGGLARRLLRHLSATARSLTYERISLVAVGGSDTFWAAHGFAAHPDVPLPDGYGADALYMSKALPGTAPRAPHAPPAPPAPRERQRG
ncbi:GNAT family N-acetyltransferase [Streptomyces spectabilis]|uniref:GNAT family N-acetyltransferase n=1 Tax=Streptomyces spectabilis TaxID=68270 RepID=A0A5P2XM42_STRST|nr:GNAT family N-acetyltransferase [Streptomyces spectabilis]MBB5105501.1 GNAT superfamily N-acetyltransferase [Streptomyces spectabilis]MCI3906687.1 GNAT family N-acetyltransferase [Streptomyces spectabilis]QEV63502.1 GNAT family N-acetyltransferase [Streptomyces spectabilis]GGV22022.1 N-acetyltransferase [Streptomyces spectabilis]